MTTTHFADRDDALVSVTNFLNERGIKFERTPFNLEEKEDSIMFEVAFEGSREGFIIACQPQHGDELAGEVTGYVMVINPWANAETATAMKGLTIALLAEYPGAGVFLQDDGSLDFNPESVFLVKDGYGIHRGAIANDIEALWEEFDLIAETE